jgi:2-hydroxycyclohexanecarboxyl-CoA dehydrogenase
MDLTGKFAIVTGAASGVGRATALQLAASGACVFVADRDESGGTSTVAQGRAQDLKLEFLSLDLTAPKSIDGFARSFHERAPKADILVNCAGWNADRHAFAEGSPAVSEREIWINLLGPINLTRRLLPPMIAAGSGRIVNVASDAGRTGVPGVAVYSAAKGGLIAFSKALALELARYKINVNCVSPGPVDTPLFNNAAPPDMVDRVTRAIPLRRVAQPNEVADAILFFAGPRSEYITGQVLSVNGGMNT